MFWIYLPGSFLVLWPGFICRVREPDLPARSANEERERETPVEAVILLSFVEFFLFTVVVS